MSNFNVKIPQFDDHMRSEMSRVKKHEKEIQAQNEMCRERRLDTLRRDIVRGATLHPFGDEPKLLKFEADIPNDCGDDEVELIVSELADAGWSSVVTKQEWASWMSRYASPGLRRVIHYGSKEAIDLYIDTMDKSVEKSGS